MFTCPSIRLQNMSGFTDPGICSFHLVNQLWKYWGESGGDVMSDLMHDLRRRIPGRPFPWRNTWLGWPTFPFPAIQLIKPPGSGFKTLMMENKKIFNQQCYISRRAYKVYTKLIVQIIRTRRLEFTIKIFTAQSVPLSGR